MGKFDRTVYESHTIDLAELLSDKTSKRSKGFVKHIASNVKGNKTANLYAAIKEAKQDYKGVFKGMEAQVRRKIAGAMYDGAEEVSNSSGVKRSKQRLDVVDGLTKNVEFYSEAYFRRIAEPKIKSFIKNNKNSPTFKRDLEAMLTRTFKESEQYWKSVADTVQGRAYNFGVLKGAQMKGYSKYMLIAVVDNRTTPFCRSIDGTTFNIQKAIEGIEELSQLRGKDTLHGPWIMNSKEAANVKEMKSEGFLSPPFHANCRTRTTII